MCFWNFYFVLEIILDHFRYRKSINFLPEFFPGIFSRKKFPNFYWPPKFPVDRERDRNLRIRPKVLRIRRVADPSKSVAGLSTKGCGSVQVLRTHPKGSADATEIWDPMRLQPGSGFGIQIQIPPLTLIHI